jgi:hypothetical protein
LDKGPIVLIPSDKVEFIKICDFCLELVPNEVDHIFQASESVVFMHGNIRIDWGTEFGACDACANLIYVKDWSKLLNRMCMDKQLPRRILRDILNQFRRNQLHAMVH